MKIALFINYGTTNIIEELANEMKNFPFPQCRINMVNFIQTNGTLVDKHRNIYQLANSFYEIKDVDASRPWTICEYDGYEYLQYLDYEIVDKNLNYGRLKAF